ncbi:U3 small nucleolar ribonucleoprotein complex, subunit Mpp10 [Xylariaceae sp. FL0804]|nr:U3 small nucleolar ribonucleoprotein complex, subunit Mpp10 [Xylariaceae sp. FL0804]
MAGSASTTSSMTSTSHTLTQGPSIGPHSSLTDSSKFSGAMDSSRLFEAIKSGNRHGFLQPSSSLPDASLQFAKATLDAYAGQVSEEQQTRQREARKKRKRSDIISPGDEVLRIKKLHVDGFESGQIWQQAKRIITGTLQDSKERLRELEDANGVQGTSPEEVSDEDSRDHDSDESAEDLSDGLAEEVTDLEAEQYGTSDESELEDGVDLPEDALDEDAEGLDAGSNEDQDEEGGDEYDDDGLDESSGTLVPDPNGLNDGFFSIDDFNKQTQWFENADARADPDADRGNDEEEIDWHGDPFLTKLPAEGKQSNNRRGDEEDDDDIPSDPEGEDNDEEEEGGATFGDMDLDAPEGESEDEAGDDNVDGGGDFNANDVFYKDFFAPPQRKRGGKFPSRRPRDPRPIEPDDDGIDRAMADVRRDLFEDESDREDSDDALSDVSAGDPRSRRSAHERRQAKLAEEIRKLEAANVAPKKWAMSGETKAPERPMNSLLEEDLDFEHVGKPVPVITAEVSESIEDMIKRRILAQDFDEVIRRRPESSEFQSTTRRGLVNVDDSKAKQGLADIYEEEHIKNANPDTYTSKADEKLQKEEKEIEQMWKGISASLDALSSWHYKPKPAAPSLTVVPDVATISMEDAQPTTAQGVGGGDNTLAPQEVYRAGKDTAERGEIVAKSGLPVARQEMSREDKAKRRRREKERTRKAGGGGGSGGAKGANGGGGRPQQQQSSTRAQQRDATLGELRKGGVKVINKRGEIVDVEGNKAKATRAATGGNFKL